MAKEIRLSMEREISEWMLLTLNTQESSCCLSHPFTSIPMGDHPSEKTKRYLRPKYIRLAKDKTRLSDSFVGLPICNTCNRLRSDVTRT